MSTITIPEPTIEEQALEDFDPLPQLALASSGVAQTRFQLMLPCGERSYETTFVIEAEFTYNEVAVRYSQMVPPTHLPMKRPQQLKPGDRVHVVLTRGRS